MRHSQTRFVFLKGVAQSQAFEWVALMTQRCAAKRGAQQALVAASSLQSSQNPMALEQWAIPELGQLLPLDEGELHALLTYTNSLPDQEATQHLEELLGNSPNALRFIATYIERRRDLAAGLAKQGAEYGSGNSAAQPYSGQSGSSPESPNVRKMDLAAPNMGQRQQNGGGSQDHPLPLYAPPSGPPPASSRPVSTRQYIHTNPVIEAGKERARDEQEMQQMLQQLQFQYRIYNSDIEPEHDTDFYCNCPIHQYQYRKQARYPVQERWSAAVMYPGEKHYNDNKFSSVLFSNNPYRYGVVSPYGYMQRGGFWGPPRPQPSSHARSIHQTIQLNNQGNRKAQADVDAKEPKHSIWENDTLDAAMSQMSISNSDKKHPGNNGYPDEKATIKKRYSQAPSTNESMDGRPSSSKPSKLSGFKSALGIKSTEEKAVAKVEKAFSRGQSLREQILAEENGRWPDEQWRQIVATYQDKVGMTKMIADLRARKPIQYLHLLRAGYFEPIPVAWANQMSNPLKFTIDAAAGWRGITPAWRGYEDTAEERLYWVLNHREGSVGMRMKPDFISEMNMARDRMAKAVEPPPLYFDAADTCHVQHTSDGYSKQVMPPPFRPYDQPEQSTDDTMVLLDVSGSMDFDPVRPVYNQYLITGYERSTQPKNKDVAKAIIRRFTDAMANHDRSNAGYEFTTFSNSGQHIGTINHRNFDSMWRKVRFGGGTRVMTGWQLVKELHFQKHSESATHHPVYGWQAGPETPILRLLLLLDGEATDMDEFELDLLSCSWAHVTIFLIGVDGCPHHHRHANELQRISDVNHHVSFVDAQGNCPERFVTHELLKRHLGYDITMREFEEMEAPPAYDG